MTTVITKPNDFYTLMADAIRAKQGPIDLTGLEESELAAVLATDQMRAGIVAALWDKEVTPKDD